MYAQNCLQTRLQTRLQTYHPELSWINWISVNGQEWDQVDHVLGDFILGSTETMQGKLYKILVYYCIRDGGYIYHACKEETR